MRITYLLTCADDPKGAELTAYAQALRLADRSEVEFLSVFRAQPKPPLLPETRRPPVRHLVDRTRTPARPVRDSRLDEGTCRTLTALPSALEPVDPARESPFDRLSDLELAAVLPALDTDVLVTTSPALLAAAVTYAPTRVVTVHQGHLRHQGHQGHQGHQNESPEVLLHSPRLDALVTPTERTRLWLAESLGAVAPELAVIPYAVPDGFRPSADGEGRVIVTAARLDGEQRVDHAIRAFAQVADAHPDWTLRIFGDGSREQELRRLVDGFGLQDRVQLLGTGRDMAAEWAEAGLALLTSGHDDAFPLACLEALAAGVPVVAYDVPAGPAETVRHRVDGLLVQPGDVDGLAAALSSLMGDPETRHRYAPAARRGAYDRFSSVRVTGLWEDLFARLVARRDRPERLAERADRIATAIGAGGCAFRPSAPYAPGAPASAGESARENELLECGAAKRLVRSAGRLAEERDDLTLPAAVDRNLQLTAAALESYAVPYVLVRTGGTTHTLAVDADERDRALKALAEACSGEAVYAEPVGPRGAAPGPLLAERLDCVGEVAGVRIFRPVTTSTRTLRYGAGQACTVAFWSRERADGPWRAPFGSTLAGARLDDLTPSAELTVAGRRYPTLEVFAERLAEDVDFPVDAVYAGYAGYAAPGAARVRNRDQLRYSLRSLAQYAPWIRHVHLVTTDRPPSWLDTDHPGLTVVAPEGAFPDFRNIEGLSEHFLHFDDRMFLGRPTRPDTFFLSSGLPRVLRPSADEHRPAADERHRAAQKPDFGRTLTHDVPHVPYALRGSILEELAERYADEPTAHARSRLHQHYAYLTGRAVPAEIAYEHVDLADRAGHARLGRILQSRDRTAFSIGESPGGRLSEQERTLTLRAFLTAYLPVPSPYERT